MFIRWLPLIIWCTSSMHKLSHMKHLSGWVTLLKNSLEMAEMYSYKWIIYSQQNADYKFSEGELVPLFHLFLFQKRSPAFALCQEIRSSVFSLCFPLQSTCNHYMVIKRCTIEVSDHSFIQNLGSALTRSALKMNNMNVCHLEVHFLLILKN